MFKLSLAVLLIASVCFGQLMLEDDESLRQKYGMSQEEWRKYKNSGINLKELEKLIQCGITINEYISRPWISLGVSESEWIDERCKGMSDEAIQAFSESGEDDFGIILAFLLPGSYHWANKFYGKASAFSGIFVGSIALYFLLPAYEESTPQATADGGTTTNTVKTKRSIFLIVGVLDMVMSAVFAYRDLHRAHPQDEAPKDEEEEKPGAPVLEPSQGSLKLEFNGDYAGVKYIYSF